MRQGVTIVSPHGVVLAKCLMVDVGAGGAQLRLQSDTELPDQFIMVLSRDGTLTRHCSVAWRSDNAIGVQFLQTKDKLKPSGELKG